MYKQNELVERIKIVEMSVTLTPSALTPPLSVGEPEKPLVILVHGFFRTRHDMAFLHRELECMGYAVMRVELPITRGTIADGVCALQQQLEQKQLQDKKLAFVAHSMGGLVVRAFVAHIHTPTSVAHASVRFNISHCVFIGTPHRGTPLANLALHVPGVARFFRALPYLRAQPEGKWAAPLLRPLEGQGVDTAIKIGIIVASCASFLPGRLLIAEDNDGLVPQTSAITPDADAVILLPFSHIAIHKRNATSNAIARFLTCGQFDRDAEHIQHSAT